VSDRAREGVFSSLGPAIVGVRVLDLYAGTGAMGIEALSRGAEYATFVDQSAGAARAIASNLEATKLDDAATVTKSGVVGFLHGVQQPVDLAFLDPPYALEGGELEEVLDILSKGWMAADRAWTVVLTRPTKSYTPVIPIDWRPAKRLVYGDTLVILYREV
jgi:16S rRNA (guanine966-N2)-methyltransferase